MAKLLLVEDSKAQAFKSSEFLRSLGHEVTWAPDGASALKKITSEPYDLALLDIVLPDMDGMQICKWLRNNTSTKALPIIMLTAKTELSDKVGGLSAGADDYLNKPYSEEELRVRIEACLRTKALQDELAEKNAQLKRLLKEVKKLAITDPLTCLYNRRHFGMILVNEFYSVINEGQTTSCLLMDIDHFKKINDIFGHATGDTVIKKVAQILLETLEKPNYIARWGGEEFLAMLPCVGREQALGAAEKVRATVAELKFEDIEEFSVTLSIGISTAPDKGITTPDAFVDTADRAMYLAKANGRNRVEVFDSDRE